MATLSCTSRKPTRSAPQGTTAATATILAVRQQKSSTHGSAASTITTTQRPADGRSTAIRVASRHETFSARAAQANRQLPHNPGTHRPSPTSRRRTRRSTSGRLTTFHMPTHPG